MCLSRRGRYVSCIVNLSLLKYSILLLVTAPPLLATPDIAETAQNGTKLWPGTQSEHTSSHYYCLHMERVAS